MLNVKKILKIGSTHLGLFLIACGTPVDGPTFSEAPQADTNAQKNIIVGSVDWDEVTRLSAGSPEALNARSVGLLDIPTHGSRCTGFLVSDSVVMTNEHCIGSAADAVGVTVSFNAVAGAAPSQQASYDCSTFLGNNASLDYALLECRGNPGAEHGVIELEARSALIGEDVYVIHQNCDYYTAPGCSPTKKYSPGRVVDIAGDVYHDADTLGGSSGSPVFARGSHKVFAIHHTGIGSNGNGRGTQNGAVPMTSILLDISARFPNLLTNDGQQNSDVPNGGSDDSGEPAAPSSADPFEPNDTAASATPVTEGFSGSADVSTPTDLDRYRFTVQSNRMISISLQIQSNAGDLDLRLLDSDGQQLAVSTSTSPSESVEEILVPGTYEAVVFGHQGAQGMYSIVIDGDIADSTDPDTPTDTSTPDDGDAPNSSQPGSTMESALAVAVPEDVSFSIGSAEDRHLFVFDHSGDIEIVLNMDENAGDLDLYVYDENAELVTVSNGVTNIEQIELSGVSGGFIQVVGYQGATGGYQMSLR